MALRQLDPVAALVLIDLQKGIVGPAPSGAAVVRQAAALAGAFRERGLPVVLVNVEGGAPGRVDAVRPKREYAADWAELVPELGAQPSDKRVTKHCFGAFLGTDLDQFLREKKVTQIVLAGISTSIGVESTARSAYDLGYNVAFVQDAMTDSDAENHRHSVEKIFPRLGEVAATADVLRALGTD